MLIVRKFQGFRNQRPSRSAFEGDLQRRVCNPQEVQRARLPPRLCLRLHTSPFDPERSKHTMNTVLESCTSMPSSLAQFPSFLLFIFLLVFDFDMQFQVAGDHASSYTAVLTQSRTVKVSSSHYIDTDTDIRNCITAWGIRLSYTVYGRCSPLLTCPLRLSPSIQGVAGEGLSAPPPGQNLIARIPQENPRQPDVA